MTPNVSTVLDVTRVRVVVYHGSYGCDTGCCGHYVELPDGTETGWTFSHPYGEDFRAWALEYAQEVVTEKYGVDHVADLDWDSSLVSDD